MEKQRFQPEMVQKLQYGVAAILVMALGAFTISNMVEISQARQEELKEMCGEDLSGCVTEELFFPPLFGGSGIIYTVHSTPTFE